MNTCPHCHIRVGGDTAYSPLCQNRLPGSAGEPYFPATAPRIHRASLLYKIVGRFQKFEMLLSFLLLLHLRAHHQ